MKKKYSFYWLLALPYVVTVSSGEFDNHYFVGNIYCGSEHVGGPHIKQTECEDLAAALNEAHERRTQKVITMEEYFKMAPCAGPNSPKSCGNWKDSKPADWQKYDDFHVNPKQACGQDDCGQDTNE